MTKSELIAGMAEKCNLSKADAERALNALVGFAKDTLKKEGRFALAGLGSFVVKTRKARKGRNPQTGEVIDIKERQAVRFKAGKTLQEKLN
ncbi:MAG: HU family DNA-binding protein [Deltaproteobacteria bacterium]|nr:HU family DNA-binding protein [Deltaproteobacteria bacterium]